MTNSFLVLCDSESPHSLKVYLQDEVANEEMNFSVISTEKGVRGLPPEAIEVIVNVISDVLYESILQIVTKLIARFRSKGIVKGEIVLKEKGKLLVAIDMDQFPEGFKEDIKEIEFIGIKKK